jgi:hypothetical protein
MADLCQAAQSQMQLKYTQLGKWFIGPWELCLFADGSATFATMVLTASELDSFLLDFSIAKEKIAEKLAK